MDVFSSIISALLIIFMAINFFATYKLYQLAKEANWKIETLTERFFSAAIKTGGSLILAFLGANRLMGLGLIPEVSLVLLSVAILMHSLPPVLWLYYYKTHRFERNMD